MNVLPVIEREMRASYRGWTFTYWLRVLSASSAPLRRPLFLGQLRLVPADGIAAFQLFELRPLRFHLGSSCRCSLPIASAANDAKAPSACFFLTSNT